MHRFTYIVLTLVVEMLGVSAALAADAPAPLLDRVFTATNHEGKVFTEAKILSISTNHVLVTSTEGPGKVFFTNLPPVISAELAGLAVAQRLNTPDQPRSNRRNFYEKILDALHGKTDEEKIKAFGPMVDFCVTEMKKLNQEMSETEATGKQAIAAEEKKAKLIAEAAASQRDLDTARAEQAFATGKISAQQRDTQLLATKEKFLAADEQGKKDFASAKARVWNSVISVGKDQKAAYDELVNVLKRVQEEQEQISKRLQGGAPAK
ncbi:MAG: hypothetical protein JWM16_461 [Verrucomicrobiales bacterium]|nr:hypothetical protein [Verrucomicrobiales bacterium]